MAWKVLARSCQDWSEEDIFKEPFQEFRERSEKCKSSTKSQSKSTFKSNHINGYNTPRYVCKPGSKAKGEDLYAKMATVTIGEKIKALRKERGWTQGELAERLGVKPQNISRYEKDRVQPREATLALFADVFGLPIAEFTSPAVPVEFSNLDPEIADYVRLIPTLSEKDQFVIKRVLKALINEKKVQKLFAS